MVPHANWHHPTSEHTKYSIYQQQCNGSKCSLWGMKMTTQPKLAELSFYPLYSLLVSLNAEVLVVVVVVGCVKGSWSQVFTFSCYSHCLPLTQNASKGMKQFSRTCAIIQIKYVLPKLCHLPQYSYGSRDPTTRLLGFASYPGLGTRDPYSYWGRWHSMATHT